MSRNNNSTTILQFIAIIVTFVVLAAFLFSAINTKWDLITEDLVITIVNYVQYFGALLAGALFLLDYAIAHSVIMQIIVCILVAATAVFQVLTFDSIQELLGPF